jgi:uncharacterized MAPEG superfamily protein
LALVRRFHRSIEKHRLVAMMFVIHRGIFIALILLRLPCFRSCLSVWAIPSHMSSTEFISMSVLIRQDGLDAI